MAVVVGAGLAGCEAAWQLALRGVSCRLYEMRPETTTPAHQTDLFAELVCSNSLGSALPDRATGLLQAEMARGSSLIMETAAAAKIAAGGALAVDREVFARQVTAKIQGSPLIVVEIAEMKTLPSRRPAVIATGPLTSPALAESLARSSGREALFFYDAMAPIVDLDSVDRDICFRASRYGRGDQAEGDYLNCPMDEGEYDRLVDELLAAKQAPLRDFERDDQHFFEGCLPIEELARRGRRTLAFGPLRPVGLSDPRTGWRPHAVVQLRRDNVAGTLYNMVGFQTNLTFAEQRRVFRLIPGLADAEFVRLGQMHRNTFLRAPAILHETLEMKALPGLFVAGQLAGVEGYVGSVAAGWLAGVNAARLAKGRPCLSPPADTMTGGLMNYLAHANPETFQPMKANFGLLPRAAAVRRGKRERYAASGAQALASWETFLQASGEDI